MNDERGEKVLWCQLRGYPSKIISLTALTLRVSKAERAERSGLPRFFFGYFLCSNDKESNNKI
jgi:hypothetical protein